MRTKALTLLVIVIITSCRNNESKEIGFIKDSSGLQYNIISDNIGDTPKNGQYIKLQVRQLYNDSLLSDTRDRLPQYQILDSTQMSKESYSIFSKVHVGDSLTFKVPSDSAFKTPKPAFAKKKGFLVTYVKVEAILSETEAQADLNMEKAKKGIPVERNEAPAAVQGN